MSKLLITVCGRAGSKGFKNKNLKTFCSRPLVHYTLAAIELFLQSRKDIKADVVLNTDSGLLKELVKSSYPHVIQIHRPAALSGDAVAKMCVFQHSLKVMEEKRGSEYDYHMDLDITSPLRTMEDVAGCFDLICSRDDLDVVMSACKSRRNPYMNMAIRKDGYVQQVVKSDVVARQQAPVCYDLNASIYAFRRDFLFENESGFLWDGRCEIFEMEDTAVLDIDSEEDFEMMEIIARHLYANRPQFAKVRDAIK